jgi:uncharacterized membrane protein
VPTAIKETHAGFPFAVPEATTRIRVQALDILRGLVMVIMTLDHTRDFVHSAAMAFPPEDLGQTTPAIFMTRWITHFCAPVFMFCAGAGAFLRLERVRSKSELFRFLWTRGLWLIVLEFTVVRAGFFFNADFNPLFLLVFWALGMSMIALALLLHLPYRALLIISIAMIALHNLFDSVTTAQFGAYAWVWQVLHQQGLWVTGGPMVIVAYPLVPWIGVMAAGYGFGRVYRLPAERRRTLLLRLGVTMIAAFVVLRGLNGYGDPRPWATQREPIFTWLSFLNVTKYPASLDFLLMTVGPAIVFLGRVDRFRFSERHPLSVFGRVPLFYFVGPHPADSRTVDRVDVVHLRRGTVPVSAAADARHAAQCLSAGLRVGSLGRVCRMGRGGGDALSRLPLACTAEGAAARLVAQLRVERLGSSSPRCRLCRRSAWNVHRLRRRSKSSSGPCCFMSFLPNFACGGTCARSLRRFSAHQAAPRTGPSRPVRRTATRNSPCPAGFGPAGIVLRSGISNQRFGTRLSPMPSSCRSTGPPRVRRPQ